MKKIILHSLLISLLSISTSCSQGELLNSEADIIDVTFPEGLKIGAPLITNTTVRFPKMALTPAEKEKLENQLKALVPEFTLTPGATISGAGEERDFNTPQKYIVTSEDGAYHKEYEISFFNGNINKTEFSFEHVEIFDDPKGKKKFNIFYEIDDIGNKLHIWDSGNEGFAITNASAPTDQYPTASTPNGKTGKGAKLTTSSTGKLGSTFGMPIAAGNLFLGYFNIKIATSRPLDATEFGIQTTIDQPKSVKLWAKYKEGPEYKDKEGNILDTKDRPEVYAVLYEAELDKNNNPIKLNGHNIRTAPNIVSIAVLSEEQVEQIRVRDLDSDEYVHVEIPFKENENNKFDSEKQEAGAYYITIVFSSSAKGNLFEGAIGSTLLVDEIEFITEETTQE